MIDNTIECKQNKKRKKKIQVASFIHKYLKNLKPECTFKFKNYFWLGGDIIIIIKNLENILGEPVGMFGVIIY